MLFVVRPLELALLGDGRLARVHHYGAYNDSDAACHVPVLLSGLGPYQFRWVHGNRRPSNVPSVMRTRTPSTPLGCTVCVRLARLAQRMSPCPNEFLIWAPRTLMRLSVRTQSPFYIP